MLHCDSDRFGLIVYVNHDGLMVVAMCERIVPATISSSHPVGKYLVCPEALPVACVTLYCVPLTDNTAVGSQYRMQANDLNVSFWLDVMISRV